MQHAFQMPDPFAADVEPRGVVREAGEHVVRWRGEGTASGVYLLRLRVGNFVDERRMTLAK